MPKMEFRSNARPTLFAYPPPLEEKKREEREKVTTAVLSIAARARRREAERRLRDSDKMEVVRIMFIIVPGLNIWRSCISYYLSIPALFLRIVELN